MERWDNVLTVPTSLEPIVTNEDRYAELQAEMAEMTPLEVAEMIAIADKVMTAYQGFSREVLVASETLHGSSLNMSPYSVSILVH
jgi:hypothetical protein